MSKTFTPIHSDQPEEQTAKTPLEDLRAGALKHYEEASSAIHHWSSFVENAIKAYNPIAVPISVKTKPTPSVESMEDVLKDALSKDGLGISLSTEDRILSAMQHWASIKCAEKDREIAELRQLKEVTELALSSSANTIEDMEQELSTKEEAVKELVEGLDVSLRAMTGLVRQLPVDESLADYNLDFCEIAEQAAKQLITKHKTP